MDRTLQSKLEERPQHNVRLIVRVKGNLTPAMARLAELDATVLRSFTLINAVAITCSGQTALALLSEPWVQMIEEDRPVSVQKAKKIQKGGQR